LQPLALLKTAIQRTLLPALNEELGPLSAKERRFVAILEVVKLEAFTQRWGWCGNGRKPTPRIKLASAFLAKSLWNMPTTSALIDRLKSDVNLRRLCGWENGPREVPNESTFSRAFLQFATTSLPEFIHQQLVVTHLGSDVIWHASSDATSIEGREKPAATKPIESASTQPPRKRGRPRKGESAPPPDPTRLERHLAGDLTTNLLDMPEVHCSYGCKKNAKGHTYHWIGYKLHLCTGDGDVPLAAYLSTAALHDSQPAIILQQQVAQRTGAVFYDLGDAAYDAAAIKQSSERLGRVPIIDPNPRGKEKLPMEPDRAHHYKARSGAERTNSQLKDNHGGRNVRVRGAAKVMCHLMFGVVVMTAEALFRLT
jgi:hypothetical protein